MQKHKFNIFPEMSGEEYQELLNDINVCGYDENQPITIYENAVLDGWNRFRACEELGVEPTVNPFFGNDVAAINFVMRSNKRRNLTSQQWAAIAADADDIVNALEEETERQRREKQIANANNQYSKEPSVKKLTEATDEGEPIAELTYEIDENANRTNTKLAKTFNTNRAYLSEARKLKETAPEKFQELKEGKTTFAQIKKEQIPQSQEIDSTRFDSFTNNAKHHGNRIDSKIRELEEVINDAARYFSASSQDFKVLANTLAFFNLDDPKHEAKLLKRLEICPNCNGDKCKRCEDQGYLDREQARLMREATEKAEAQNA